VARRDLRDGPLRKRLGLEPAAQLGQLELSSGRAPIHPPSAVIAPRSITTSSLPVRPLQIT
jgi:hypothetical protein